MTLSLMSSLTVLALIDATSFGTLLLPLWLMLAHGRPRPSRILIFLGTVAAFYLALGALIITGVTTFKDSIGSWAESHTAYQVQFWVGAALVVVAVALPSKSKDSGDESGGRRGRWRDRVASADGASGVTALMGLALLAAAVEAASMVPYLGAIGLISTSGMPLPGQLGVLAGYCVLMCVPAVVLLVLRLTLRAQIEPTLRRVSSWMERQSGEWLAWILGIIGFLLASDAVRAGGAPGWLGWG